MTTKTTAAYFSPTENTKKSVQAMAEALGNPIDTMDLTVAGSIQETCFDADTFVILGVPVYGGRIPIVAKQRLALLKGTQTPCIVLVSYGNRHYDDALLELSELAAAQGFLVKGAAAVVGRHTYGDIQTTRPDANDLAQDRAFALQAAAKADDAPMGVIPGNMPYKDGGKGGSFRPETNDTCISCGLCVKKCPTQAIESDCVTVGDACISCFRCVRGCPMHAKHTNTEAYLNFAAMFTEKLKQRRENEYFL